MASYAAVSRFDDYVLQFHRDVLHDVQTRVVNASLLTNLALTSPLSRVVMQAIPPVQMKAHWAAPELELTEDGVTLSVEVAGGARYIVKGVNVTMEGKVAASCRPVLAASTDGQPVVRLTEPSATGLDLGGLKLSYAADDAPFAWTDGAFSLADNLIERTLLQPTLSAQLLAPLSGLPLTYLPGSLPLPLRLNPAARDGLPVPRCSIWLDPKAGSLSLAMGGDPGAAPATRPPNLLPARTGANVAVALSETGLNRTLGWLCARGLAEGTSTLAGGPVSWRWANIAATFTDSTIRLTGQLWHGPAALHVDLEVRCALARSGELSLTVVRAASPHADLILDAWSALLHRLLFAATHRPAKAPPRRPATDKLRQRFGVPGTDIVTDAPAVDLALRHGYLVALYAVPPDEQPLTVTLKQDGPQPTINQRVVPRQTAPGAPVTVTLDATLARATEPPYDFAWRVDSEPHPRKDHGPTITITKTPPPPAVPVTASSGPQKLATICLTVIDMLGRDTEIKFDATYYPAAAPQQEKQKAVKTGGGFGGFVSSAVGFLIIATLFHNYQQQHHNDGLAGPSQTLTVYTWDPDATVRDSTGRVCAHSCRWQVTRGTRITLTATEPGPIPMNWVGCANSTTGPNDPCTLVVYQNSWICLAPDDPYQPGLVTLDRCRREAGG